MLKRVAYLVKLLRPPFLTKAAAKPNTIAREVLSMSRTSYLRRNKSPLAPQRFGTGSVRTHEIGAALLKGSFQAAVDLLLRPRAEERADAAAARAYFARTRDAGGTLAKMPHYMNAERSLLQRLRTAPHDWVGALACIPRTLRMM